MFVRESEVWEDADGGTASVRTKSESRRSHQNAALSRVAAFDIEKSSGNSGKHPAAVGDPRDGPI
jgi:hypothetical protein